MINFGKATSFFFDLSEDQKEAVRKSYNVTKETIKQDVEILKEWIKKQNHLPQDFDDYWFEKSLLYNKFQVEQTKIKIDSYCSFRFFEPDLFTDLDRVRLSTACSVIYFMPKLTPDQYRLVLARINDLDIEKYTLEVLHKNLVVLMEFVLKFDYNAGIYIIIDIAGVSLSHMAKVNLSHLAKIIKIVLSLCSTRIVAIDVINAPGFAVSAINFVKSLLASSDTSKKMQVFKDFGDIYKRIPKEYLPEELNGTCSCQKELLMRFDDLIEENQEFLATLINPASDESKRIADVRIQSGQDFGLKGTFKQINID